ncbi:MAG: hypothetical protein MR006_06465 [Arcanobacterium sp.]|nr:hypothetical protein [Arcanobacterium sp.]
MQSVLHHNALAMRGLRQDFYGAQKSYGYDILLDLAPSTGTRQQSVAIQNPASAEELTARYGGTDKLRGERVVVNATL